MLIKLKASPRKAFLILALEYISLRQTFALSICSQISSAYDKMLLSLGRVASPCFHPNLKILCSSFVRL